MKEKTNDLMIFSYDDRMIFKYMNHHYIYIYNKWLSKYLLDSKYKYDHFPILSISFEMKDKLIHFKMTSFSSRVYKKQFMSLVLIEIETKSNNLDDKKLTAWEIWYDMIDRYREQKTLFSSFLNLSLLYWLL